MQKRTSQRRRRNVRRVRLHAMLAFAGLTLLFEMAIAFFDFDLFTLLLRWLRAAGLVAPLTLIGAIWAFYNHYVQRKRSEEDEDAAGACPMPFNALTFLRESWRVVRGSPCGCFLCLVLLFGLAPAAAAHYRPIGRSLDYMLSGMEQFRYQEEESLEPDAGSDAEAPPALEEEPEEAADELRPFLEEPDRYCVLSQSEQEELYFFPLAESEIPAAVAELVQARRAQRAPNAFDGFAPPDVEAQVAGIETDYTKLESSAQLDAVIEVQMTAWQEYPKYSLAWMLANDFQEYGNQYYRAGGHFETIEYYFAQSVFWSWETLTYESASDYQVRQCLHYISLRYHDIAAAAPDGSQTQLRAQALCRAFADLENLPFA